MTGGQRWRRLRRLMWEPALEGLYALGAFYGAYPPPDCDSPWDRRRQAAGAAGQPSGPPPRHPERVRPDLPLSSLERFLARQLGDHHGQ